MNIAHPLIGVSERMLEALDPERLYDQIVQTAMDELHADRASLMLWNERAGRVYIVALAGMPLAVPVGASVATDESISGWVLEHREPLLIEPAADPPPELRPRLRDGRLRSAVCVPLIAQDRALGVFNVARQHGASPFTATDRDLIALLGSQIAITITMAQLYHGAQRRAERLTKLNSLNYALAATLDLDQMLDAIAGHLRAALPIAQGYVFLVDGQPPRIDRQYPFGTSAPPALAAEQRHADVGLLGQMLADGAPRSLQGQNLDERLAPWERQLVAQGDQALLCVALKTDQETGGAIMIAGRPGAQFDDDDLQFLVAVADAAAPAIAKALLHDRVARLEARYRALFEHARDAVLLIDSATMTIVAANPAAEALSGYSRRELADVDPLRLITVDQDERPATPFTALIASGRAEFEAYIWTRDGSATPVALGLSQVAYDGTSYLLLIARDSSERQRLTQQLAQTEKLAGMGRLASSVAHEINNPLQAIHNSLHLLVNRPLAEEKRTRYLSMAHEEVERLIAIVQRMLDFYRPAHDGMRPISLHTVLDGALGMAAQQLQERGVEVSREWSEQLPRVHGVGSHLKHVFFNLALNAAEAMPNGGRLIVRTRVEQGLLDRAPRVVLVEFIDTGPGIPRSEVQAIFEPFYTTKSKGTGLGLAVSYSIVERHKGILSVSTDGSGTTFRVALPALEGSEPRPA